MSAFGGKADIAAKVAYRTDANAQTVKRRFPRPYLRLTYD